MKVNRITIVNDEKDKRIVNLDSNVKVIMGKNGSGKTDTIAMIEKIYIGGNLEVIKEEKKINFPHFIIDGISEKQETPVSFSIYGSFYDEKRYIKFQEEIDDNNIEKVLMEEIIHVNFFPKTKQSSATAIFFDERWSEEELGYVNKILQSIYPDLSLTFVKLPSHTFDAVMVTYKGEVKREGMLPDGVIQLIKIVKKILPCVKNKDEIVFIDGFDSDLEEQTVGVLVKILSEFVKGHLIITCHSLIILEVLDKTQIDIFENLNVPENINLRTWYLKNTQVAYKGKLKEVLREISNEK